MVAPGVSLADRILRVGYSRLGNAEVVRASGDPGFLAFMSSEDDDIFNGSAQSRTRKLRYVQQSAPLHREDLLTVNGDDYEVREEPRAIGDGREFEALLVRV